MKFPAYITRAYLARMGHSVKLKPGLEEYTLDNYPGIVFTCKKPENGATWTVTTRKLEPPSPQRE